MWTMPVSGSSHRGLAGLSPVRHRAAGRAQLGLAMLAWARCGREQPSRGSALFLFWFLQKSVKLIQNNFKLFSNLLEFCFGHCLGIPTPNCTYFICIWGRFSQGRSWCCSFSVFGSANFLNVAVLHISPSSLYLVVLCSNAHMLYMFLGQKIMRIIMVLSLL